MQPGNLNFLEPSGPPQACNGTAFLVDLRCVPLKDSILTLIAVCYIIGSLHVRGPAGRVLCVFDVVALKMGGGIAQYND
jgi:hypothetical protein